MKHGASRREESERLHARARAFARAFEEGRAPPEAFDALACDLARFQAAYVPGYARLCSARALDPATFRRAADAPAVPQEAFKLARVFAFDDGDATATFRTSGTTGAARGVHAMRTTETYDLASVAFARHTLTRGLPARVPVLVLGPAPRELPDASLAHMIARFVEVFGEPASEEETYFVTDGVLDLEALDRRVARLVVEERNGVLVMATSFALVHVLDALGDATFPMPRGTRVMHTGGYKGRSRELDPAELRRDVARAFGVGEADIACEYGMTELTSQFYEAVLVDPAAPHGVYLEPPWARVVPVDPETLAPVAGGEVGVARIEDLMNVDSAFCVLASDRVRSAGPGRFELLGRARGAPPRGCSIAIDDMLSSGVA